MKLQVIKKDGKYYAKSAPNRVSSLTVNSTYISDVDMNQCVRNGNVVRVDFRGKVKANIPNDIRLLDFAVYSWAARSNFCGDWWKIHSRYNKMDVLESQ